MPIGSKLDPSQYLIQRPRIKDWFDNRKDSKFLEEVGPLALFTSLHIVLVSYFTGEIYGFTQEILDKMKRDMEFYQVDEVVGLEEAIARQKQIGSKDAV